MNVALALVGISATAASVQYLIAHDVRGALRSELHRVGDAREQVLALRRAEAERRIERSGS